MEDGGSSPEVAGSTNWFSTIMTLAGLLMIGLIAGAISGWVLVRQTVVSIPASLPTLPPPMPAATATRSVLPVSLLPVPKGARLRLGSGSATTVNFSPSGDRLALGTSYGLYLYSFPALKELWYSGPDLQPNRVAFAPDGKLLAVGSLDNKVTVWDLTRYKQVQTLTAGKPSDYVIYLAFAAGGKSLLARSSGGEVRLWDVLSGTSTWQDQLSGDPNSAFLDASADGLLAIGLPQDIRVIEEKSGRLSSEITKINQAVQVLALSPAGNRLAFADFPASIHIISLGMNGPPMDLRAGASVLTALAFSEDGKLLASVDEDSAVTIWDTSSGRALQNLKPGGGENFLRTIDSLQFSPDSGWLLGSAFQSDEVTLWNLRTGEPQTLLNPANGRRSNSAFSPDSRYLAYSPYAQPVTIRSLYSTEPDRLLKGGAPANAAAFWPNSKSIAASFGQTVLLYDDGSGQVQKAYTASDTYTPGAAKITRIASQNGTIVSLYPLPDGKSLLGTWQDGSIGIWSGENPDPAFKITDARDAVLAPNGKSLVIIDARDNLVIADPKTGGVLESLHQGCSQPAFSPDSLILAAVCLPRQVVLFNAVSHELIKEIEVLAPPVEELVFSPDGRRLMALYQQSAIIDDVATSQQVSYLSFNGDSPVISNPQTGLLTDSQAIIGDASGLISQWELDKGALVRTLNGHRQAITNLSLSADGKSLLSSSRDGTVLLWQLP